MTDYPYYKFLETGGNQFYEGRYWNANGKGICIVAVVTRDIDWAAYVGADGSQSKDACLQWTAQKGVKLLKKDAKYFFPDIELPYRP